MRAPVSLRRGPSTAKACSRAPPRPMKTTQAPQAAMSVSWKRGVRNLPKASPARPPATMAPALMTVPMPIMGFSFPGRRPPAAPLCGCALHPGTALIFLLEVSAGAFPASSPAFPRRRPDIQLLASPLHAGRERERHGRRRILYSQGRKDNNHAPAPSGPPGRPLAAPLSSSCVRTSSCFFPSSCCPHLLLPLLLRRSVHRPRPGAERVRADRGGTVDCLAAPGAERAGKGGGLPFRKPERRSISHSFRLEHLNCSAAVCISAHVRMQDAVRFPSWRASCGIKKIPSPAFCFVFFVDFLRNILQL